MDIVSRVWSFLSCGMSDLNICKICQATLLSKIEVLGKTANVAVLNIGSYSGNDGDEDTSDDEIGSDNKTECLYKKEQLQESETSVHNLLQRILLVRSYGQ